MTIATTRRAQILRTEIDALFEQPRKRKLHHAEAVNVLAKLDGLRNDNVARSTGPAGTDAEVQALTDKATQPEVLDGIRTAYAAYAALDRHAGDEPTRNRRANAARDFMATLAAIDDVATVAINLANDPERTIGTVELWFDRNRRDYGPLVDLTPHLLLATQPEDEASERGPTNALARLCKDFMSGDNDGIVALGQKFTEGPGYNQNAVVDATQADLGYHHPKPTHFATMGFAFDDCETRWVGGLELIPGQSDSSPARTWAWITDCSTDPNDML